MSPSGWIAAANLSAIFPDLAGLAGSVLLQGFIWSNHASLAAINAISAAVPKLTRSLMAHSPWERRAPARRGCFSQAELGLGPPRNLGDQGRARFHLLEWPGLLFHDLHDR
jgi:hypothetical protein